MVRAVQPGGGSGGSSSSGLADVIDTILDKGLVIDAYIRVSLVGIELLTIEARIIVASVDTYLRFAEAVNRLDLSSAQEGLPGLVSGAKESGAKRVTKGVLEGVGEKLRDFAESGSQRPSGQARSRGSGQRPRLPLASTRRMKPRRQARHWREAARASRWSPGRPAMT